MDNVDNCACRYWMFYRNDNDYESFSKKELSLHIYLVNFVNNQKNFCFIKTINQKSLFKVHNYITNYITLAVGFLPGHASLAYFFL